MARGKAGVEEVTMGLTWKLESRGFDDFVKGDDGGRPELKLNLVDDY